MSNLFSKILGNITTRIMFIIYVTIIFLTAFFIVFGYYNQLALQEQRQYDKLKAIVTSTALNIDGFEYELLMNDHPKKDDIKSVQQNISYYNINRALKNVVIENELNSPMYTLDYIAEKDIFHYGVRSDDQVYFRHEYVKYPPILKEKMNEGGTIPMYESENGIWLSAFHPIKKSNGDVVGVLEADIEFSYFKEMVNQQYLRQAVIALAVIVLISFLLIPYARKILKADEKQKALFMRQKMLIEESHREIKDSINYAKRIQNAILPSQRKLKENFPQSFVLYLPKDIVAGDFYWMENLGNSKLIAACDCTGHGVPGAMVSVICNNALNRAVREYGLSDPGQILDKTREIVIAEFEKSDEEVKDGMDVSLFAMQGESDSGERLISWAGANNPLWILRKDSDQIEEIKADKQPIGKYSHAQNFTTHSLKLREGDTIFIFTDGYQDQFGGDKGKKFKAESLKKILIESQHLSMDEHVQLLIEKFNFWRGKLEQVDDVCVIGLRV